MFFSPSQLVVLICGAHPALALCSQMLPFFHLITWKIWLYFWSVPEILLHFCSQFLLLLKPVASALQRALVTLPLVFSALHFEYLSAAVTLSHFNVCISIVFATVTAFGLLREL